MVKEVLKLSRSTIPTDIEITRDISDDCGLVLGIKGFLMKPVVKSVMAQIVRKVLDEAKCSA